MSTELTATLVGAESVRVSLQTEPERIQARVRRAIERSTKDVQRRTIEYLQGPRPEHLGRKTSHLARSINERVEEVGWEVTGRIGTNLEYGRFWELGFHGVEQVRAFERITRFATKGGKFVEGKLGHGMRVFAKKRAKNAAEQRGMVRAHERSVDQNPRPFLRPALADYATSINLRIRDAISGKSGGAS